jgi:bacteriocin-like protein
MKKLEKKEMKNIVGGQPPYCIRVCNYEYRFCLTLGNHPDKCAEARERCYDCECDNIC